jgi:aspartate/methionine/tyrosine aminotransferase
MKIEEFQLERLQSIWENRVRYNLTESGIHPYTLRELLTAEEIDALLDVRQGYGWTNGKPELREAIRVRYPGAGPEGVLVTNGSAEANFLAMWTLLEPGDEVVLMVPNYMQIWGIARSFGVEVKSFRLREELGWAPDIEELREQVTPRTKVIAVCDPNNPTGAVLSPDQMKAIVEIADRVGSYVYSDEVYRGAELDGREQPSFHGLYDRVIVTAGLSKALAHPGLRIGWLVGPEDFIADAWHRNDYTTITTSSLSEHVATLILQPERRRQILERNRGFLNENLDRLVRWVDEKKDLLHFVPPKAGGMAFLRYELAINSSELSRRLRDEKSLLVLPGDVYGMDHYIRIGIGDRASHFAEGLALLNEGLEEIGRAESP